MSISVRQLTETAFLRTRFLAGARAGARNIRWAHTCELPDPWNWLGEGELLMAIGYNFPADDTGQCDYLQNLSDAGLAGLALAPGPYGHPLTAAGAALADALPFPVLETEFSVPFVALARMVSEHNSKAAVTSLSRILRVYDHAQRSDRGTAQRGLLSELEIEAGARLHVVDGRTGAPMLESGPEMETAVATAVISRLAGSAHPLPMYTRVTSHDRRFLVLPVAHSSAVLIAEPRNASDAVELVLLQHIATIAGLEITRQAQDADDARAASAQLFARILNGGLSGDGIDARLEAWGFTPGPRTVLALVGGDPVAAAALHGRLFGAGVHHLFLNRPGVVLILTDAPAAIVAHVELADPGRAIGMSLPAVTPGRIPDAAREARWALEAAIAGREASVTYGERNAPFLPRTLEEARLTVDRILGPLYAHDTTEGSDLLATLRAYFDADRSWQVAAKALGVHKQTVIYRIRKIETLTGRSLRAVGDQSELFFALRAQRMLDPV